MRLVVLFTYGMSLDSWRRQGLIDRELAYYRHLIDAGADSVTLFTYGPGDGLQPQDGHFELARRPSWLGHLPYSLLGPLLRRRAFTHATIVKSNQSRGAWTGVVEKWLHPERRFVVRCGWVRTRQMMTVDEKLSGWRLRWAEAVERLMFRTADRIFVTASGDRDYVIGTYAIDPDKIDILPNAVDTAMFTAAKSPRKTTRVRVMSVGRLVPMKNFQSLIQAVSTLPVAAEIVLVGDGPHRADLEQLAATHRVSVEFRSFLPNAEIPRELQQADIFVMPQLYGSGMSKVLLEAMACGVVVVASDIPPHREVIDDGVNGFLSGPTPDALADCLSRICALPPEDRERIAARARFDCEARYSMRTLAAREVGIYRAMLAGPAPAREAVPR